MTVTYRILETRRPTEDLVVGYVRADFAFPDRATVSIEPWACSSRARRRRLAHPALPGVARRLTQRGDDLALEQLDAGAVVGGLGEVQDRVLAAEVAQPLQLLDDLFGCATGGVG